MELELVPSDDDAAAEVTPLARVKRSRLALALAVTVAALPLIALDNLPAIAQDNDDTAEVAAVADEPSSSELPSSSVAPESTTTAPPTTAAPTTTEAPSTTQAPAAQAVKAPPAAAPAAAPVATTPPATAPPATSAPSGGYGDPADPATWDRLAQCESGGRWDLDSGNGYYGGLQFSLDTWRNVGGSGYPHENSREEQIHRGQILQAEAGWGQWPHCSKELGYY